MAVFLRHFDNERNTMKKFNGSPAFLGITMSILFSFNAYAGIEGWKLENNNWKYYKEDKTLKAWQKINDNWYFFNEDGSLGTDLNRDENLDANSNIGNNNEINREQRTEGQGATAAQNPGSNIAGSLNENIRTENEGTTDNKISDSGKVLTNNSQNRFDNAGNEALNRDGNIADETGKSTIKENYNKVTKNSDNKIQNDINNNILEQSSTKGGNSNVLEQNNSNNAQNQNGNTLEQSQSNNTQNNTGNTSKQSNVGNTPNLSGTESNDTGNTLEQNNTDNTQNQNSAKSNNFANENNTGNNSGQSNAERENPGANTEGNLSLSTEENKPSESDNTKNPTEQKNIQEQPNNAVNEDNAEDKAERIKDTLTTPKNNNVVQYTDEDGEIRTIIWAKGINAPVMGEGGDFHKEITQGGSDTYEIYKAPFSSGDGWYDVNKTRSGGNIDIDKNLCFAAVASNMLHWWFDQNIENVDNYIAKNGDITCANRQLSDLKTSFESQEDSKIFELYKVLYGYNERGFYTDLLVDLFINGYTPKLSGATNIERDDLIPDNNGGFFYDVFKGEKLTDRTYGGNYESLSEILKEVLGDGGLVGLSHKVFSRNNHIVTLWGAEYDLNGKLRAVYVSDSDDQDESNVGMKRYEIRNVGGIAKLSTNIKDKSAGAAVGYLHILYLGSEQWNNYFR